MTADAETLFFGCRGEHSLRRAELSHALEGWNCCLAHPLLPQLQAEHFLEQALTCLYVDSPRDSPKLRIRGVESIMYYK